MSQDRFQDASGIVEKVLSGLGLDAVASKVRDEAGSRAWGMARGSAQVLLIVSQTDAGTWIRIVAPVVKLPAESARLAFFARLLELNAKSMRNAAFGVMNDGVVVVSERPAEGLDAGELEQMLRHVGAVADHYDDLFIKEYGVAR